MMDDVSRHLMSAAVRRGYENDEEDELLEPIVRVIPWDCPWEGSQSVIPKFTISGAKVAIQVRIEREYDGN
jgi:hypothetical protein